MYVLLVLIGIAVAIVIVLNLPVFGKSPRGARLERIKKSPNYRDGSFQNQSLTPTLPPDLSYWQVLKKVMKGNPNGSPKRVLPHGKQHFERSEDLKITWFGHSSYLIQVDGANILVDPVFSKRPSPFQFIGTVQFKGTDFIRPQQLPPIDILLLTHDHYDHLDYGSILQLKAKTKHFITSLGVGEHLEHWGIGKENISELNWKEELTIGQFRLKALPARHFSGRKFRRNQTLWSSFILFTEKHKLYLGGDSGYDHHFREIGMQYGPFDLAILECGQYNDMWPLIHLAPEEVITAAIDLKAKHLMPVHWGKYKLALHDWDEPIRRLTAAAEAQQVSLITPMLGETFNFDQNLPQAPWWLMV